MNNPKIYLVLDNCFAIKRWVEPEDWGQVIKDIGFKYIEASFDNEIDFLYSPKWYIDEWFDRVRKLEKDLGLKVATFYTGYQTYRTAGLAHPNDEMADHLMENWLIPAIKYAGAKGAGLGFSFHAIANKYLQSQSLYEEINSKIFKRLAEAALYAKHNGEVPICVEAMYAPHQTPWTIDGTINFIKKIYKINNAPIYTTVDVGHMIGQIKFRKPTKIQLKSALQKSIFSNQKPDIWLGAESTYNLWNKAVLNKDQGEEIIDKIYEDMSKHSYLFSYGESDSNPYAWLEKLGCYSPIMHLQQTDGITASHAAFTKENNRTGIINGPDFLRAIQKSYQTEETGMPPKAQELYLSFEIFASNTEYPEDIKNKLKETLQYWRQFIPEDGTYLNDLVKLLEAKK